MLSLKQIQLSRDMLSEKPFSFFMFIDDEEEEEKNEL